MNAVCREKLVVPVTVPKIFFIPQRIAVGVGFLDRATCGSIVACDGEPQGRTVGIGYLPLYESFAERAASDDRTPVVVLQRSGQNFAGGGAEFVDQHRQGQLLDRAVSVAHFVRAVVAPVFGIDDQLVGRQEFVGDADCLVEETAGIAPQVEDQSLHTLCLEVVQGGDELVVRGDGELGEFDVADAVGQHEGRFEAFDRNGAARHFDLDWFCDSLPFER